MKKIYIYFVITFFALFFDCNAQSITLTPKGNISSQFSLASTSDISQTGIPSTSQLIYNTNINITGTNANGVGYYFWNGTNWQSLDANIPQNTIVFSETHPNQSLINTGFSMIGTTQVSIPALDVWRKIDTLNIPLKRFSNLSASYNNKFYFWGFGTENNYNPYEFGGIYDPINDQWTKINTVNSPNNSGFSFGIAKDRILSISSNETPNEARIYNPYTNTWSLVSTLNAPNTILRYYGKQSNYIFSWNGQNGKVLDLVANSWTDVSLVNAPINSTIEQFNILNINLGDKIIVWYGGDNFNEGHIYDIPSSQWSLITNINQPEAIGTTNSENWSFSSLQNQNFIHLTKRVNGNTLFKIYDIIQNIWLDVATLQNFTSSLTYLGNYIEKFFFINSNDFKIIEFNKNSNQWRIIPNSKYQEYESSQRVYFCGGKIIKYEAIDVQKGYSCDGFMYDILTETWSYLPPVFGRNVWGNNFCNNEYFISIFGAGLPRRDGLISKISGIVQLSGTTNQTTPKTLYLYRKN